MRDMSTFIAKFKKEWGTQRYIPWAERLGLQDCSDVETMIWNDDRFDHDDRKMRIKTNHYFCFKGDQTTLYPVHSITLREDRDTVEIVTDETPSRTYSCRREDVLFINSQLDLLHEIDSERNVDDLTEHPDILDFLYDT